MIRLFVFLLVVLGVTKGTAVSEYNNTVTAKGTAKCNGHLFGQNARENANVSVIHRRYAHGDFPPKKPLEELVRATVTVKQGRYLLNGTRVFDDDTLVMLFLRLTYVCAEFPSFTEVQIPEEAEIFHHDFSVHFDGP